jgi:hypothetical protein
MKLTLDLPPELSTKLTDEAARLKLPLPEYALRLLQSAQGAPESLTSGSDLVAYWDREGLIDTRADIQDSSEHARSLREAAEKRE